MVSIQKELTRGDGNNSCQGFTLTELVVTMIIIGILAAAAIPRFVNLGDEAKQARFAQVRGSFKAGVSLAHGKAMTQNLSKSSGWYNELLGLLLVPQAQAEGVYTITMNGVPVDMTSDGWPAIDQNASNCGFAQRPDNRCVRLARTEWLTNIPSRILGVSRVYAGVGGGGDGGNGGDGGGDGDGDGGGDGGSGGDGGGDGNSDCMVLEVLIQDIDVSHSSL